MMTTMTGFILAATLLVLLILAILLPPLLRAPKARNALDRRAANLCIFRDQLSELERDHRDGSLADADFAQAKSELQRRLLDEVQPEVVTQVAKGGRKTALALLIALPLAASAGYLILGNPQAFMPQQAQASVTPQQIDDMLNKLVAKLKKYPDDPQGWMMLARSYKVLGRYPEAVEAYSHGGALLDSDAALLADYAEALARANGDQLDGKPTELLEQALKIDPNAPQALFLAGAAATDRKDFAAAAAYWSRLLTQLEADSEEAKSLLAAINNARAAGAQSASTPTTKP